MSFSRKAAELAEAYPRRGADLLRPWNHEEHQGWIVDPLFPFQLSVFQCFGFLSFSSHPRSNSGALVPIPNPFYRGLHACLRRAFGRQGWRGCPIRSISPQRHEDTTAGSTFVPLCFFVAKPGADRFQLSVFQL